jgi:hypothetical protein
MMNNPLPTIAEIHQRLLKSALRTAVPYLTVALSQAETTDQRLFCWRETYNHMFNALHAAREALQDVADGKPGAVETAKHTLSLIKMGDRA